MKTDQQIIRAALWVSIIGSFFTPFMGAAINIALPVIGKEFHLNAIALSWVATSYLLAAAMVLVPVGKLADIYGRKRIYLIGIIGFTVTTLACGLAFSGTSLIIFRVLQGLSGAMLFSTSMAILMSVYPAEKRGRAIGWVVFTVYSGLALGPVLGGILTQYLGWRSLFLINVPIGLLLIFIIIRYLKGEWAEARGENFDFIGSLILGFSLSSFIYGMSKLPSALGFILSGSGVILLFIFIRWELKSTYPVLNLDLFRKNRVFAMSNLAALINYSATFAVGFLLSLYLQYVKGLNPRDAGLILVAQPIVMAIFSPMSGRLSEKIEPRILSSIGMAFSAAGLIILTFFNVNTSHLSIILSLLLLGFGFALFSTPNTNAVMSSVEKRYLGIASATLSTMRLTGQMLSMGVATLTISIFVGNVKISSSNIDGFLHAMQFAFIIFALLCVLGVFASLTRGKHLNRVS